MMKINISDVLGTHLTGATKAKNDFPKLIVELSKAERGATIVLDFSNVEIVTASYWNSILQPILRFAGDIENELFPIFFNLSEDILEDFKLILDHRKIAVLISNKDNGGLKNLALIGAIDYSLKETFKLISQHGEIGASDITSKANLNLDAGMPTSSGWNNRLTALYQMRLIRRLTRGRSYKYRPVYEVENG